MGSGGRLLTAFGAALAVVAVLAVIVWTPTFVALIGLGCLAVLGIMFLGDTGIRGRSQFRWSIGALFAAPVELPVWLALAVWDRRQGRQGLESLWPRPYRRGALAALALGTGALVLAVVPVHVRGANAQGPGWQANLSGACGSPAEVILGGGTYRTVPSDPSAPAGMRAAEDGVVARCYRVAAQRAGASGLLFAGATTAALLGAFDADRRSRPAAHRVS